MKSSVQVCAALSVAVRRRARVLRALTPYHPDARVQSLVDNFRLLYRLSSPVTGKTTVANHMHQILTKRGYARCAHIVLVTHDDFC